MTQVSESGKLAPISEPDLDLGAVIVPDEGPLTFEFSIEVRPDFELPSWKGLSINRPAREIGTADVDEALGNILRERGRYVPHAGPAGGGDLIVGNLSFRDGKELLSRAEELEIIVRPKLSFADAELEGFDALVAQAKPGETVTATVRISDEAAAEELRGKEVTLELELLEIKKHELPSLTPVLLEELGGFETEEALGDDSAAARKPARMASPQAGSPAGGRRPDGIGLLGIAPRPPPPSGPAGAGAGDPRASPQRF